MITDVLIQNFRCFRNSSFRNFRRVNLIGGKNNSGKTAFLEAIFLNTSPRTTSVDMLRQFRQIDTSFVQEMPERAWNNLFLDKTKPVSIEIISDSGSFKLDLTCDESVENILNIIEDSNKQNGNFQAIKELFSNKEAVKSTLQLNDTTNEQANTLATLVAHSKGITGKNHHTISNKDIFFIPASLKLSDKALSEEFGKADLAGKSHRLLQAFQIIDENIEAVKTINIGQPTIYLKSKNEDFKPIGLYGDAINKVSHFILKIINSESSILLIDEIENGIHSTAQSRLWKKIFELAEEFDVQIFATTHSIEMIASFIRVVNEEEVAGGYYEFFRHHKTNEISSNTHDVNTLLFELENNIAVRGE